MCHTCEVDGFLFSISKVYYKIKIGINGPGLLKRKLLLKQVSFLSLTDLSVLCILCITIKSCSLIHIFVSLRWWSDHCYSLCHARWMWILVLSGRWLEQISFCPVLWHWLVQWTRWLGFHPKPRYILQRVLKIMLRLLGIL